MKGAGMRYVVFIVLMFSLGFAVRHAHSHDWFTGMTVNPDGTGGGCCSGSDCREIPEALFLNGAIRQTAEGYVVSLTLEQAQFFNSGASKPVTQLVPYERVQSSRSYAYGLCIWRNEVRCFFAPSNS